MIRLAIPNKGRIAAPIMDLMEKSGLHLQDTAERKLIARTLDPHVEILFARPIDIPEYVATGAADLGITGHDMVCERESDVEELLDLQIGKAKLVLAVREDSPVTSVKQLKGAKIATEFPVTTKKILRGPARAGHDRSCRRGVRGNTPPRDCRCDCRSFELGEHLKDQPPSGARRGARHLDSPYRKP